MNYKLYSTSEKAWDAMLWAIRQAEKSIYIEMYTFENDTKSHNFIGQLKEKARKGISIAIVADAFGSRTLKKEIENGKRESKIEFIFFSHWLRHIHRKILIVDEKIAFIGGVNIGKRFKKWSDLQLELRGRTVKKIIQSFAYTYAMAGGKNKDILDYRKKKFIQKFKFWLIEHWPAKNIHTLKKYYVEKITQAQKSIQIATPYFTPPRWLISLLDDAIRRKVSVEIFIPKKGDWKIVDIINYRYMSKLHPLGINFFLTKKMNHSKLLIIDEKESLIGSQNIDLLSFKINSEAGVFFREKKLLQELQEILKEWKSDSCKFQPEKYRMKFYDYVVLILMKIFHPIL